MREVRIKICFEFFKDDCTCFWKIWDLLCDFRRQFKCFILFKLIVLLIIWRSLWMNDKSFDWMSIKSWTWSLKLLSLFWRLWS